jgi:putative ABC transport system permease protein
MHIQTHNNRVPTKNPDFFLATTSDGSDGALEAAVTALRDGPGAESRIQIDTRLTVRDRDQSSLAALNIAGLVDLDSGFALAMAAVAIAIFVFGLQLQRRREYVTLRALGLEPGTVRFLILGEAAAVALGGVVAGVAVGAAMGSYFVAVLRPLFVLPPVYILPPTALAPPVLLMLAGTLVSATIGSRIVNRLQPTELLRDD